MGETAVADTFIGEARAALGPIDILVNSAGTSIQSPLCDHSEDDWLTVINTNLNGAFRMTRAVLPPLGGACRRRAVSKPSISGIMTSSRTRSYAVRSSVCSAWSPLSTAYTIRPWYESDGGPVNQIQLPNLSVDAMQALTPDVAINVPPLQPKNSR